MVVREMGALGDAPHAKGALWGRRHIEVEEIGAQERKGRRVAPREVNPERSAVLSADDFGRRVVDGGARQGMCVRLLEDARTGVWEGQ
jgi:hypothetical protein